MVAEPQEARKNVLLFRPGDTVRVHIRVVEGDSERIQIFEGTVIRRRGRGDSENFTVRKISFGVGVERTFPISSPHIAQIEVIKSGRVRRSRLYYLRGLTGRAARLTEAEGRAKEPQAGAAGASADGASPAKPAASEPAKPGSQAGDRLEPAKRPSDSPPAREASPLAGPQRIA